MSIDNDQIKDLVNRIVDAVHPERIILFGSHSRGEAGRFSDIDVLVIAPEGVHRIRTAQEIYLALRGFGIPVDVVVATPSDIEKYADSPGLVYREALREGTLLYAA